MRDKHEGTERSLILNEGLATGWAMKTDTAERSAIVVVWKLIGVDNTVATVVFLQLLLFLLMTLEVDCLVVKIIGTGLLRLCVMKL